MDDPRQSGYKISRHRPEGWWRSVAEGLPFIVIMLDRDGRIVEHNAYLQRYTSGNSIGHLIAEFISEEHLGELRCSLEEIFCSGESQSLNGSVELSGVLHSFRTTMSPVRDPKGNISYVTLCAIDVTEDASVPGELDCVDAHIARAAGSVGIEALVAGIAHEINNPLCAVYADSQYIRDRLSGVIEILRSVDVDPSVLSELDECGKDIGRSVARLRETVNLLRNTTNTKSQGLVEVDVKESMKTALRFARGASKVGRCKVSETYGAVPPVLADPARLVSAFLNIIVNAGEAFEDGNKERNLIQVHVNSDGMHVHVHIVDNGPGIDPERLVSIFKAWYTTKPDGVGLGLSLVKATVEAFNGTVSAKSQVGCGTEFHITLPAAMEKSGSDTGHESQMAV